MQVMEMMSSKGLYTEGLFRGIFNLALASAHRKENMLGLFTSMLGLLFESWIFFILLKSI